MSPVKHFVRTCREPFALRDVTFEPGDMLYLSYASANRDEEVFPDAFRLDVRRENAASHLAFGFGRHFCLGAHLARMEIRALFRELLARARPHRARGRADVDQGKLRAGTEERPDRLPDAMTPGAQGGGEAAMVTGVGARSVGARVMRVEDPRILTGRGRYVDDIVLPGMLHAAFLRS